MAAHGALTPSRQKNRPPAFLSAAPDSPTEEEVGRSRRRSEVGVWYKQTTGLTERLPWSDATVQNYFLTHLDFSWLCLDTPIQILSKLLLTLPQFFQIVRQERLLFPELLDSIPRLF